MEPITDKHFGDQPIVNRVAESDLEVFNLEDLWDGRQVVEFDMSPMLHHGIVLREKEFRASVREYDWSMYEGDHVALFCSTDAVLPTWAPMLIASKLDGVAASVSFGNRARLIEQRFAEALAAFDWDRYKDRMVVVKGCSSDIVPPSAYVAATNKLQQVAKKIMFGEPCSTVPLWRRPK